MSKNFVSFISVLSILISNEFFLHFSENALFSNNIDTNATLPVTMQLTTASLLLT